MKSAPLDEDVSVVVQVVYGGFQLVGQVAEQLLLDPCSSNVSLTLRLKDKELESLPESVLQSIRIAETRFG